MIGGNGERRTLRLVARYGDACNFLVLEPDEIRAKLVVLRAHCDDLGRDMREIEITALDEVDLRPGRMSAADVVARARAQAAAGVQHLIVNMPDVWDVRHLELIGREVVRPPGARGLSPLPSDLRSETRDLVKSWSRSRSEA